MHSDLKNRRVVDKILTAVVMGYNLDQEFSGHHLFPDVTTQEMGGKIIKFGKEAYIVTNTKRAPGETVRGISVAYSADDYVLENRLLEAIAPEEHIEVADKLGAVKYKSRAVQTVMRKMRLEGEYDKATLADDPNSYAAGHTEDLTGGDRWSDENADVLSQINDAKSKIRAKTGREPNVLHIDYHGYNALKRNKAIREAFKYSGKDSITTDMLASYFDIDKVIVAKAVYTPDADAPFEDIFKRNARLAFVPPKNMQAKEYPSFGYTYVGKGYPKVEKEYFDKSDRSWHNPVLFRDKAIITDPSAGFLLINTTGA